jgi:hypothetical protein
MDPELKRELVEIHALAKDNHQMLRAIRRGQWYSFWGRIIFWAVVIIIPFLIYQHYLEPLISTFTPIGAPSSMTDVTGLPSFEEIQKLIDLYTRAEIGQ